MSLIFKELLFDSNSPTLILQQIMKDRWINTGFEEDELKPYTEPELDITDQKRIGKMKTGVDCAGKNQIAICFLSSLVVISVELLDRWACDTLLCNRKSALASKRSPLWTSVSAWHLSETMSVLVNAQLRNTHVILIISALRSL